MSTDDSFAFNTFCRLLFSVTCVSEIAHKQWTKAHSDFAALKGSGNKHYAKVKSVGLQLRVAAGWPTACWKWVKTQQRRVKDNTSWVNTLGPRYTNIVGSSTRSCSALIGSGSVVCFRVRRRRNSFLVTLYTRGQTEITWVVFLPFSLSHSPSFSNRKKAEVI